MIQPDLSMRAHIGCTGALQCRGDSVNQWIGVAALVVVTGIAMAGEFLLDQPGLRSQAAIAALDRTQSPLAQAITLAEHHVHGRASSAELESARGAVIADVSVVTPDRKHFEVKVNAIDGTIVSSKLKHAQEDDD